jgi:hypothetical protein
MSLGSIYYHFVDARRRPPRRVDDFRTWLADFGDLYSDTIQRLESVDPYFMGLAELRTELARAFGAAEGRR